MKLCMIILNYNDSDTVINLLDEIKDYKSIDKVIVVDNCSNDDSVSIIKKNKSIKFDLIQTKENKGYAYGNNYGIKYAIEKYNPEYILISNPDISFKENIILKLISNFDTDIVGITSPMIIENGKESMDIWKLPTYSTELLSNFILTNRIIRDKMIKYDKKTMHDQDFVEVVYGCFFMMKVSLCKQVGFFDENTFLYFEENILSYKLKEKGLKIVYDRTIQCEHKHSVSISKSFKKRLDRYKILLNSREYYLSNILKISKFRLKAYKLITILGLIEKKIIYRIID